MGSSFENTLQYDFKLDYGFEVNLIKGYKVIRLGLGSSFENFDFMTLNLITVLVMVKYLKVSKVQ